MDVEVKQPEQSPRVSGRTPKRKTFFDEDEKPQPVAKKKLPLPAAFPAVNVPKRQSIDRQTAKPKVKTTGEPRKAVKKCDKSGCNASLPICFVNATERCAGNGYTSRWYHISPAEHFCNECFEYYYRSHKDGYDVFTKWKREWSSNSKSEASIRAYMVDQLLPYWLQCTLPGCGKWRQISRHLELTPDFVSRFSCGMSYLGVKTEKQTEHCDRIEDDRATHVRTAPWFSLQMIPSFLYQSPAVEYLGGLFFPDRVGMSPSDPTVVQYANGTKVADTDTDELVQPFALTLRPSRPIGALSFDPASMSALEEREFPGYVKDQVMYLGLRNLVLALWAKNVKNTLKAEQCVPHVICRGIARIRYVQDLQDIVGFLTRHAFINYGLLPPPANGAYLSPAYNQESVLVIGAGAAGLAAARHLTYMGTKVTVLEGRDRIGGRVWDTSTARHGAQMIMGHINNPLAFICLQTGIEMRRLEDRCDLYKESGQAVDPSTDRRMDFHFNAMLDNIAEWRKTKDKTADTSLLKKIWEMHHQFVEESQLEFTQEELQILEFHLTNLEFACGAPLDQVSCLYWDQNEAFPQFAGDHIFIKGGLSQVLHKMADGLDVRLNSEVCKIDHSSESVCVTTKSGETFQATKVLVTVPLAVLQKEEIVFEPAFPEHKQTAIKSIGMGLIEKVVLEFNRKFWGSKTRNSPVFGHLPSSSGNRGMFNVFYDLSAITKDSKESGTEESHVLMSHVTGASVDLIKDLSDAEVADKCLKILAALFPDEDVPEPISCVVTHWRNDKFAHMAYSYLPIGVDGSAYDVMAEEVNGRVHFAGEATSREFPQSVTGAYLSGIREANKILESSARKSLDE